MGPLARFGCKSHKLLLHLFLCSFIYSPIPSSIQSIVIVDSLDSDLDRHQMNMVTLVYLILIKSLIDCWVT